MKLFRLLIAVFLLTAFGAMAAESAEKPRVVVLTDISNEPDDEESLVRFLVYTNEFEVEALVATTSTWLKDKTREDIIRRQIEAYGQVRENLFKHAPGFPSAEQLLAVTRTGQPGYGMASVGEGKSTPGSQRLIEVMDQPDPRPVWITIWGGANTLAQALTDVKAARDEAAVTKFIAKLRVYSISDQDDAGYWLRRTFPKLFYIVSPSTEDHREYYRAAWTGISGDWRYQIGVMHHFEMVGNPWLDQHVIKNHGPLGALYPKWKYIMEGDTPSFLGLINNGLGWAVQPDFGGWGGRYREFKPHGETRPIFTDTMDSRDTVTSDDNGRTETSQHATIWRWREHFQNDFAARMDWCMADKYQKANHNPIAVLNGDKTKKVIEIAARSGDTVTLSAEGTSDPDGDALETKWWIYSEAGTLQDKITHKVPAGVSLSQLTGTVTSIVIPDVQKPETLHIILEVSDSGKPKLWAYRRAVVSIKP